MPLDAAVNVPYGAFYVFRGNRYANYKLNGDTIENEDTIHNGWPGLQGTRYAQHVDAVCGIGAWMENRETIYLFSGDRYARYYVPDERIQREARIEEAWPGLRGTPYANGIDAACINDSNERLYFFKEDRYVNYNLQTETILRENTIAAAWPGLRGTPYADGIDAAAQSNRHRVLYFFKGSRYTRYNVDSETMEAEDTIAKGWPGLKDTIYM
ncbi:hemopexin repeat-containing protein [Streptomyces sp. NPDC029674]|uniref:hemopexin repeat-containing protein n=1 Tax=Streptomyces sp. NPDC029674 TaxID=3365297 RepID=UPI003850C6F1